MKQYLVLMIYLDLESNQNEYLSEAQNNLNRCYAENFYVKRQALENTSNHMHANNEGYYILCVPY